MEKIKSIVSEVTGTSESDITEESAIGTLKGWDSLTHLQIVLSLEAEFGISLSAEEIMKMTSIRLIQDTLKAHA